MTQKLWEVVNKYREKGILISDEEAESVCRFCDRKMDIAKIQNREEYLPLLYKDELKNHLLGRAINATAMLRMIKKEVA